MEDVIKVLVWGTGVYAKRFMGDKKENVEIVGFVDNDKSLQGKHYCDKPIISPEDYASVDFDYLLISSAYSANDIYNQIINAPPPGGGGHA
ncbi:MAG: hypothetical protein LBE13_06450 [Bacteroidales bacterium]|nr:hypothetical protein [Bacteroidales bacterium]